MDTFIFILEIIGTIAFASSGAMIAIEKKIFSESIFWVPPLRLGAVLCVM